MSQSKESSGGRSSPETPPLKRSKLEKIIDVLSVIKQGEEKPTVIMYKANLSWNDLNSALTAIESKGLAVEKDTPSGRRYTITPEGLSLVNSFTKFVNAFDKFGPERSFDNLQSRILRQSNDRASHDEFRSIEERLDTLEETIEVISDRRLLKGIKEGLVDLKAGRHRKLKSIDDFPQSA